jgi:hypothetical protein
MSAPLGGGAAVTLVAGVWDPGPSGIPSVAVDATRVYWVNAGAGSVPLRGGTATPLPASSGIGLDSSHVYFGGNRTIERAPLEGGEATTLATMQPGPCSVRVYGGSVFWTTGEGETVVEAPKQGGLPATLLAPSGVGETCAFAVSDAGVFLSQTRWADGGPPVGDMLRIPVGGGEAVTLATVPFGQGALAVDEESVYFAGADDVLKVPVAGGAVITLARGQTNPDAIAVDGTSVYWGNRGMCGEDGTCDGAIWKLTPK